MRVAGQTGHTLWISVGLVLALAVGYTAAQLGETDVDAVCQNGGTPLNITWSGETVAVDCQCDKQGTVGTKCAACLFEQQGTWSAVKTWSGHKVKILASVVEVVAMTLFVVWFLMTLFMAWTYQPFAGLDLPAAIATADAAAKNTQVQNDAVLAQPTNTVPQGPKSSFVKRLGYNSTRVFSEWPIIIMAVCGSFVVYMIFTTSPKLFNDQTPHWPFHILTNYKSCYYFGAGIFAAITVAVCASMYWTAHHYQLTSMAWHMQNDYKQRIQAVQGSQQPNLAVHFGVFSSWMEHALQADYNLWKLGIVALGVVMIIVRAVLGVGEDGRTCCQRLLTATPVDFGCNIILVVVMGSNWVLQVWWFVNHILSSHNATLHPAGSDFIDQAVTRVLKITMFGSASTWDDKTGLFLTHLSRLVLEAFGIVMLSMDIAAYSAGKVRNTEPMLKGYVCMMVILGAFVLLTLVYFWNMISKIRESSPNANKSVTPWNTYINQISFVRGAPLAGKKGCKVHVKEAYLDCPPDAVARCIETSPPAVAIVTAAHQGWVSTHADKPFVSS